MKGKDAEAASSAVENTAGAAVPAANMLTHLDNIAMHKRAPVQQAIADICIAVKRAGIKECLAVFGQVGVPPHGGGGFGLDRGVAWFLALPSVHSWLIILARPRG